MPRNYDLSFLGKRGDDPVENLGADLGALEVVLRLRECGERDCRLNQGVASNNSLAPIVPPEPHFDRTGAALELAAVLLGSVSSGALEGDRGQMLVDVPVLECVRVPRCNNGDLIEVRIAD
ncbi:MAG: hypothetical protein IT189_09405 [Microbacteriaceae bacterium]|nr:hypothetical protein [Microbacteriaceae bacterium]